MRTIEIIKDGEFYKVVTSTVDKIEVGMKLTKSTVEVLSDNFLVIELF